MFAPTHFVDINGTLQELGPGARIHFNGRDGTRREIILVGRAHLDEMLADIQSAREDVNGVVQNALMDSRAETRTLFDELSTKLTTRLSDAMDANIQCVSEEMDATQRSITGDIETTKFAFRIEMDSLQCVYRLRVGGLSDLIFAVSQSTERRLDRIHLYLYVLLGLGLTSLTIGLISLFVG